MFIKKDLRKIPDIIADSEENEQPLRELSLQKRTSEFRNGSIKVLCQPHYQQALASLESLSLYDCDMQDLKGIGMLSSLQNLSLGHNRSLRTLPANDFVQLTNLKRLYLDDCNFTEFPTDAFRMQDSSLEELRLSNNQLTSLPDDLQTLLPNLQTLSVDNNQLVQLPPLHNLQRLRVLQIRQNKLQALTPLPASLKVLHASSNQLVNANNDHSLERCLQDCLTTLTHVYLNSNHLTRIPDLDGATNLVRLNLAHNQITQISVDFHRLYGTIDPVSGVCQQDGSATVVLTGNPLEKDDMDVEYETDASKKDAAMAKAVMA